MIKSVTRTFPNTRLRRLRQRPFIRALTAETRLDSQDLIYPVFVVSGQNQVDPVASMPGIYRYSVDKLIEHLAEPVRQGLLAIALFPVIPMAEKTEEGCAAWDSAGLIPEALQALRQAYPDLGLITDVALDPYTSHGQDGIIDANNEIDNDRTLTALVKQALTQAAAGADVVAPSDMMDGRVGAIRQALEEAGHTNTIILSYAAKYASNFYGPFRDAADSKQALAQADKKQYQMDSANADEALHEVALDLQEGADCVLVKPGLPCLDILNRVKQQFAVPTFVYQVSGEYAMLKAAAEAGWLSEREVVLESLLSCKRAGADAIFTYYAPAVLTWLTE